MKFQSLLICICLFFFANYSFADSPLTSTPFYKGYMDLAIIKNATKSKGIISKQHLEYLTDSKNPIAVKLALINCLGWNFKGQSNASKFIKYVYRFNPKINNQNFIHKATPEELICYAYLKAMDNYFNIQFASKFASQAKLKAPTSFSIQLIGTLIQSQKLLDSGNWCDIYTNLNQVRNNKKLQLDLNDTSIKVIFSYIRIYKKDCK